MKKNKRISEQWDEVEPTVSFDYIDAIIIGVVVIFFGGLLLKII